MQLKTILTIALGFLLCSGEAFAQKNKKAKKANKKARTETLAKPTVEPVSSADFSYALGLAQGGSLKQFLVQREGVDSAYISDAIRGMKSRLSEAETKKAMAFAAGLRIAEMNRRTMPMVNKQAVGKADSAYTSVDAFEAGLSDAVAGNFKKLSADSAMKLVERQFAYQKQVYGFANKNWLAANAKRKGVKTLESGLQYSIEKEGKGAVATDSTEVEVNYEGKLIDGSVFDSSYKRGQSATFRPDQVIKGWREALKLMPEGSAWNLYIPAELAYGERDQQNIPAGSTLIFKVEVIKVKTGEAAAKK